MLPEERRSVAVIGAGAIGSYYGGRLAEAGHDVRFLMRRDYRAVKEHGLNITSPDGDFTLSRPQVFQSTRDIGQVDWVVCALKATAIDETRELVQPCVDARTRILVLMNGLGLEERFAAWFGAGHVFGGLAFISVNRGEPGYVHHFVYGTVNIGRFQNDGAEIETALALWAESKVKVTGALSLLQARWEKLCWNIPFNGLAVAAGGLSTAPMVRTPDLRTEARALMDEVVAAGNADLAAHAETARIDGPAVVSRMFRSTDTIGDYRTSTMVDFIEGKQMEVEAIFGEPLRRAQANGVPVPRLALLTALLRALNAARRKPGS